MRFGFLGGTFKPVPVCHLALANEAVESLQLDHRWWLPANPWQKDAADLMPVDDRLEMLKRAIAAIAKNFFFIIILLSAFAVFYTHFSPLYLL